MEVPASSLEENPWNPNVVAVPVFAKLKANIRREGFIDPLLVRRLEGDRFQIIDGAHRFRAGKDVGVGVFPCVVLENVSDEQARFLTLNMNNIRGADDPVLLAKLLNELHEDFDVSVERMAETTVWDREALLRFLDTAGDITDLEPIRKDLPHFIVFEFADAAQFRRVKALLEAAVSKTRKTKEQLLADWVRGPSK